MGYRQVTPGRADSDEADHRFQCIAVVDGRTGEARDAVVFVGLAAASSYTFVDVTRSRSLPDRPASDVPAPPGKAELSFEDRLSLLLEREKTDREQRRYQRLRGHARLHLDAAIEDLNFKAPESSSAFHAHGLAELHRSGAACHTWAVR